MPYRNPLRGVHASHTQQVRNVRIDEIGALDLLNAGSVSIIDYHLGDARFVEYLKWAVTDGLEVYCRVLTVGDQFPDPVQWGQKVAGLAKSHPWVKAWIPLNEPNLEFPSRSVQDLDVWLQSFWWNATWAWREGGDPRFYMLFPPMAQDVAPGATGDRDHRAFWEGTRSSQELFASNGDGVSWHSYWYEGDLSRLTEDEMPEWMLQLWVGHPLTLIHEAGRKVDVPNGIDGLINEITPRFGSARNGLDGTSWAHAVTFWLLGSEDPQFDHQAWIDRTGGRRQVLYDVAWWGP